MITNSGRLSGKTTKSDPEGAPPKAAPSFCCFAIKSATICHYLPLRLPPFATKIATKCHYASVAEIYVPRSKHTTKGTLGTLGNFRCTSVILWCTWVPLGYARVTMVMCVLRGAYFQINRFLRHLYSGT